MQVGDFSSHFLDRVELLEELSATLERAAQGHGSFLAVVGEAGAGKTRLAEELRHRHATRATFLSGRAFQADATTPYAVWVDSLESHLSAMPRRELLHVLPTGSDLPRLFPACQHLAIEPSSAATGDLGSEQTRLFGQMSAMLCRMARDRTLVLVLDNLQWADASSIELLHAAVRSVEDAKILVLGLYRDDAVRCDSPLGICVESLERLGLARVLALPPMTLEATRTILAEETGREWPAAAVHRLHHLTQGNALFVHEYGKRARARGGDELSQWSGTGDMPQSVHGLLNERLRELDEDCRRILAFAAAFEAPIGYELLLALTGFAEERLLDGADRLCALRFLAEVVSGSDVAYAFNKPLIQATVYQGMGAARRRFLHRVIAAEVMRSGAQDAATVARHLIAGAAVGQQQDALPYLLRAAQDAVAVFGNHEAVSLLSSAREVAQAHAESRHCLGRIYLDLGESYKRLGRFAEAIETWSKALPADCPRLAATLVRSIARTSWQAGREMEALRVLEQGIEKLGEAQASEEAAFLRQEYALALARQGRTTEALDEAARALAIADEDHHPEVVARIYIVICLAQGYCGDLRSATQAIEKSIALCESLPYPGAAFLAHYTMAGLLRYDGDLSVFERHCEACMRIAEQMHSVALASWPLSIRVERYTFEGRIAEAIEVGERALAMDRTTGQGAVLPRTHAFLAVAYRMAGDVTKARRHLEESRRLVAELGKVEMRVVAVQSCAEAFIQFHEGHYEHVLDVVHRMVGGQTRPASIAFFALHPYALPLAAEAAARLGRVEDAKLLLKEIAALRRTAGRNADGAMLHVNGWIARAQNDHGAAVALLERAANALDASGRPFNAARARVDLGDALSERGDAQSAAAHYHAAGTLYTSIGAAREVAVLSQRLRKIGQRPAFGQHRKPIGKAISRREAEVAALIAEGSSNKEIAAELFLSELTIETHVKNILRKLGLKSRAQVAAYAAQHPSDAEAGASLVPFQSRHAA